MAAPRPPGGSGRRLALPAWMDGFVLGILGALVLSTVTAPWGNSHGPLHLGAATTAGVMLVFFLHGALVSRERLQAGSRNLRLHLLVQGSTYLIFPLVGLAGWLVLRQLAPAPLALGFFYLCALPSTIAAAVTLVGVARGNTAGAVFNATLSGLLGIFLTPTLVSLMAATSGVELSYWAAMRDLALSVLLPFAVGHLARPLVIDQLLAWPRAVRFLERGAIILVLYVAFCDAVQTRALQQAAPLALFAVLLATVLLLAAALAWTRFLARRFGLAVEDEIVLAFCGSQKSLANGMPMAKVLFGAYPALGLVILPMLVYHQCQLVACAVLARRYADRPDSL